MKTALVHTLHAPIVEEYLMRMILKMETLETAFAQIAPQITKVFLPTTSVVGIFIQSQTALGKTCLLRYNDGGRRELLWIIAIGEKE